MPTLCHKIRRKSTQNAGNLQESQKKSPSPMSPVRRKSKRGTGCYRHYTPHCHSRAPVSFPRRRKSGHNIARQRVIVIDSLSRLFILRQQNKEAGEGWGGFFFAPLPPTPTLPRFTGEGVKFGAGLFALRLTSRFCHCQNAEQFVIRNQGVLNARIPPFPIVFLHML